MPAFQAMPKSVSIIFDFSLCKKMKTTEVDVNRECFKQGKTSYIYYPERFKIYNNI